MHVCTTNCDWVKGLATRSLSSLMVSPRVKYQADTTLAPDIARDAARQVYAVFLLAECLPFWI